MLERIGTRLGEYFFDNHWINEQDIDTVRYWFEITVNEYVGLLFNILIGIWIGKWIETIIYLTVFILLRKYIPGYHCKTALECNALSFGMYFLAVFACIYAGNCTLILLPMITVILIRFCIIDSNWKGTAAVTVIVSITVWIQFVCLWNQVSGIIIIAMAEVLVLAQAERRRL